MKTYAIGETFIPTYFCLSGSSTGGAVVYLRTPTLRSPELRSSKNYPMIAAQKFYASRCHETPCPISAITIRKSFLS